MRLYSITLKILLLILIPFSAFSIVGGKVIEDDRVIRFQTSKMVMYEGKDYSGMILKEGSKGTANVISSNKILTSAHAVEKFYLNKFNKFSIFINGKEQIINRSEIKIRIPDEYFKSNGLKCQFDYAVVEFNTDFFSRSFNLASDFFKNEEVSLYGYGVHKFLKFYEKSFWLPLLGDQFYFWKMEDKNLRVGSNFPVLSEDLTCESSSFFIESTKNNESALDAYAALGSSGGAVTQSDQIVGLICRIKTPDGASKKVFNEITLITNQKILDFINLNN